MIHVAKRPEPSNFDALVRQPGKRFLNLVSAPTNRQFRSHRYWTRARGELAEAYESRCAYTSIRLVGLNRRSESSIDHFLPKSLFPELAYERDNFRLARKSVNNAKGHRFDIVDPFCARSGWFVLDIPSCLIKPGQIQDDALTRRVTNTISILGLNDIDDLVQERCDILIDLAHDHITLQYVDQYYPFVSHEVRRQNILPRLSGMFAVPHCTRGSFSIGGSVQLDG